jgi:membrane protease YdiL (CAAX protease family)
MAGEIKPMPLKTALAFFGIPAVAAALVVRGIMPRLDDHGLPFFFNFVVVHATLRAMFHLFAPWNFLAILPGCLALAWVAQRLRNTWPAIIAHALGNGLMVIPAAILGAMSVGG